MSRQGIVEKTMPAISVRYYTDPLCCWSWAMEPVIEKLMRKWPGQIALQYCMGGLIPDWKTFTDAVNHVSRPSQMGPVWMHAARVGNVPIMHSIWIKDPPASSYLACIAFKCVQFQSEEYAAIYLNSMRRACMIEGMNISRLDILIQLAEELQKEIFPAFDVRQFRRDMQNGKGRDAFREDMHEIKVRDIHRMPTFLVQKENSRSLLISGYHSYEQMEDRFIQHFNLPKKVCGVDCNKECKKNINQ